MGASRDTSQLIGARVRKLFQKGSAGYLGLMISTVVSMVGAVPFLAYHYVRPFARGFTGWYDVLTFGTSVLGMGLIGFGLVFGAAFVVEFRRGEFGGSHTARFLLRELGALTVNLVCYVGGAFLALAGFVMLVVSHRVAGSLPLVLGVTMFAVCRSWRSKHPFHFLIMPYLGGALLFLVIGLAFCVWGIYRIRTGL